MTTVITHLWVCKDVVVGAIVYVVSAMGCVNTTVHFMPFILFQVLWSQFGRWKNWRMTP